MSMSFQQRKDKAVAHFWAVLGDSQHRALSLVRTTALALVKFIHDDCFLYASSLTFYSLIAIVPIIAMALGLARGFGLDAFLLAELSRHFPGQQAAISLLLEFAQNLLNDAKSGVIAGVGVFLLCWSVLKVLNHTERALNNIWGIRLGRHIGRRFSDYLSLIVLTPFALILANSLALYLSGQVALLAQEYDLIAQHARFVKVFFSAFPTMLMAGLLAWLYYFLPNTAVRLESAAVGGLVCGVLFTIVQNLYVDFQIGAARYDAVYGSFVALPLLFLWIYISWLVVLLGAQISFVHQSGMRQPWELSPLSLSHRMKMALMLAITGLCAQRFAEQRPPFSSREIAQGLQVPLTYIKPLINTLVHAEILFEMRRIDATRVLYLPNKDLQTLTARYVVETIESRSILEDFEIQSLSRRKIQHYLDLYGPYLNHTKADMALVNAPEKS